MNVRSVATAMLAGLLLAGCAMHGDPAASPAFSPQAQCERDGGRWHADKNFCEHQAPSWP